jgi:non-ribosomal peptide synthetase component F
MPWPLFLTYALSSLLLAQPYSSLSLSFLLSLPSPSPFPSPSLFPSPSPHLSCPPSVVLPFFQEEQLTYRELNSRANKLARFLINVGISLEDSVALTFDRSLDLIIAMLAVLKAGATLVPLPPSLPSERFNYILSNACCKLLLTNRAEDVPLPKTQDAAPPLSVPVIPLTQYWTYIDTLSDANPGVTIHPLMIMYMIYTSGTTGKPKGVQILHENVRSRLTWWMKQLEDKKTHRVLQTIPLGFDPCIWEIFVPLIMGACLDLFRPGKNTDVVKLRNHVMRHRITTLSFTPALLNVTLDEGEFDNEVGIVWVGGEKLPEAILSKFWKVFPSAFLNDNYGPTETTICVSNERYTEAETLPDQERTIGYAVSDGEFLFLLIASLLPLPPPSLSLSSAPGPSLLLSLPFLPLPSPSRSPL